jgi:hypothetical protein
MRPLPTIASRARIIGKESRHLGNGKSRKVGGGPSRAPPVRRGVRAPRARHGHVLRWHLPVEAHRRRHQVA